MSEEKQWIDPRFEPAPPLPLWLGLFIIIAGIGLGVTALLLLESLGTKP